MTLEILKEGNPKLYTVADDVQKGEDLVGLAEQMFKTMNEFNGVGLAGNQVGILKRIFVMNAGGFDGCVLNPVVKPRGKVKVNNAEGCLSFPGKQIGVKRYRNITLTGYDLYWEPIEPIEVKLGGIAAIVVQHECDHLDGKCIVKGDN